MKKFIFPAIFLFSIACNPYYNSHIYFSDVVFMEYLNIGAKIDSVPLGNLIGNDIYITLPDSLNLKNTTGQFSYEIELYDNLIINTLLLRLANYTDTLEHQPITYLYYDPKKRFLTKPDEQTSIIDSFFQSQIRKFKFDSLSISPQQQLFNDTRRVYCNILF